MSNRPLEPRLFDLNKAQITGLSLENKSEKDLHELFHEVMKKGLHGLCFSIYEEGQEPGHVISKEQVRRRLEVIQPYTSWVRSFSCIEGNEWIPILAKEMGMKTLVGAWLGDSDELNQKEIASLISLSKQGVVDIAAVGNEVLYRNDLSEQELLVFMYQFKKAMPKIPMGYVDAYYEFTNHPKITEACDVILSNCYPFWEGCPLDYAVGHMEQMLQQASEAGINKKVIITETGWPSKGQEVKGSHPSYLNALKYFIQTQLWCQAQGIEIFYFSSFDEDWKVASEGEAGAYWGLWNKNGQLKYLKP
jgi:exo-beta-1,3-glucanase (GH17 family)